MNKKTLDDLCLDIEDVPTGYFLKVMVPKYKLKQLGSGSSRVVYDIGNGKALKVATNIKGVAQNKHEYKTYCKAPKNAALAKIFEYNVNFKYLIVEKCKPFTSSTLHNAALDVIQETHSNQYIRSAKWTKLKPSKAFINNLVNLNKTKYKFKVLDIFHDQVGFNAKNKLVFLDYGLSNKIYRDFYA